MAGKLLYNIEYDSTGILAVMEMAANFGLSA
jgi:hypothetical protein